MPWTLRVVGVVQHPHGGNQESCPVDVTARGVDPHKTSLLVPVGAGHRRAEADTFGDPELVAGVAKVVEDLLLRREEFTPIRVLLE